MPLDDLCYMSATEMAAAIRSKTLSPVEATQAVLGRIEQINPNLNAYCTLVEEQALAQARKAEQAVMAGEALGALHGVPFSVKDLVITKGVRTMWGSRLFADFVPEEGTPAVERLFAAGGILLGKTATPEFGWKGVTDSPQTGITRNPWNIETTPGGSSGGAAAQVAAGMGPLAIGTDGGGSIRIPAAFCGVYGLKPSFGRVPTYPASSHDALSHTGPLTRTVSDAALMLRVMAGESAVDRHTLDAVPEDYSARLAEGVRGLRVAWSPDLGYAHVHPEVAGLTAKAARSFAELGCTVEEVTPGFGDPREFFLVLYAMGIAGRLSAELEHWGDQIDPGLRVVALRGREYSALELTRAQSARQGYYDQVRRFMGNYDLLLTPALAVPAFKVGQLTPDPEVHDLTQMFGWTPFSYPFNLTGHPAASVPVGFTSAGLPVGLQIVGRHCADLTVLQASAAYEQAHPWAQHRPQL